MTGAVATRSGGMSAFEVEIETFWCQHIDRLLPGKTLTVWLTPNWALTRSSWRKGSVAVGTYTRSIGLAAFREDCFWMLDRGRR